MSFCRWWTRYVWRQLNRPLILSASAGHFGGTSNILITHYIQYVIARLRRSNESNEQNFIWCTSQIDTRFKETPLTRSKCSLLLPLLSYEFNLLSVFFPFWCLFVWFLFNSSFFLFVVGWVEIILLSLYRIDITGLPDIRMWWVWISSRLWNLCCFSIIRRWFWVLFSHSSFAHGK